MVKEGERKRSGHFNGNVVRQIQQISWCWEIDV